MSNSHRLSRRAILVASPAVLALTLQPVGAQTPSATDCTVGFLHGLLQLDPACTLPAPPALGMEVAPPSHLTSLTEAVANADAGTTTEELRSRGGRRQRQKARQRKRRHHKRGHHHNSGTSPVTVTETTV